MGDHADYAMSRGCEDWKWSYDGGRRMPQEDGDRCDCGGTLVIRINRITGVKFLGCSNFPKCRFSNKLKEK